MKSRVDISVQTIAEFTEKFQERLAKTLIRKLEIIGEECITIARNLGEEYRSMTPEQREYTRHKPHQPNYIDDTGNLRNSLSFVVLHNGVEVKSNYGTNKAPSESIVEEMKSKYPLGYTLILVAGMEYAAELTFLKGYDVLSSANIHAKDLVVDFFNKLKSKNG